MKALNIIPTNESPQVTLDKENGIFQITGVSLPENVKKFYMPIFDWLEDYVFDPNPETIFEFRFHYCNSATIKIMSLLLEILERILKKGDKVEVHWYHAEEDDDMVGVAHELAELTDVPFIIKNF